MRKSAVGAARYPGLADGNAADARVAADALNAAAAIDARQATLHGLKAQASGGQARLRRGSGVSDCSCSAGRLTATPSTDSSLGGLFAGANVGDHLARPL